MLCFPHFRLCGHGNTCNTWRIALFWCIEGSDVPALDCLRCEARSPFLHPTLSAGFGSLYNGLSAGLLRQATYTTARLGIFQVINAEAIKMNEGKPLPLYQKALCGLTAGGLGALVGTPADLTLIRMQAGVKATFFRILFSLNWSYEFFNCLKVMRSRGRLSCALRLLYCHPCGARSVGTRSLSTTSPHAARCSVAQSLCPIQSARS